MGKQLFKSIRSRTIWTLVVTFFILMIMVVIIMNTLMIKSIDALEHRTLAEQMDQISIGIGFELSDLKKTAVDWAEWDDPYQFVEDGNQAFIDGNLGTYLFDNLRLDAMVFMNSAGDFVYAQQKGVDETGIEPVPDPVKQALQQLIGNNLDAEKKLQGILKIPGGAMLFATNPILTSNGDGPVHGNIVIYRYLNETETAYLSQMIGSEFSLDFQTSLDSMALSLENANTISDVEMNAISESTIRGVGTLHDFYGNPAATVELDLNRDLSMIANSSVQSVLIALLASCIISMLIIIRFTSSVILSRVISMSRSIRRIGENFDTMERLKSDGYCDELSAMSGEVNAMLGNLHELHQKIINRENELIETAEELKIEVTERIRVQNEISFIAYHDHLTGLPNRIHFIEHLNHSIELAKRMDKRLAIMFLDLDGFKMINDSMGHLSGDLLLIDVSKRLKAMLRDSDSIARLGGDEFVVTIENTSSIEDIEAIARKILGSFREPFILDNRECLISTSIGVAVYPTDGEDSETLIKNADIAMYRAKEKGKNQYKICSEGIKNQILETMKITNHLFRALERGEFEVFYQPQIDCNSNAIVGAEALIRWNHPQMGLVLPGKFIHIAEQTGQILQIGEWVLRTACMQNKAWQDAGYPKIRMGVNLSVRQFQNHNIIGEIRSVLNDTRYDPEYLELEITESIAMQEHGHVIEALKTLREMGIHVAIDDFGTEYSSMSHLKQLPVDRIKIPMPFVHGIDSCSKDRAITTSLIVLAKSLGMCVIAEGVETKTQNDFLTQKMCDEIQGFYYYKPMCRADFEELLIEQREKETSGLCYNNFVLHDTGPIARQ